MGRHRGLEAVPRRTGGYRKADWQRVKAEMDDLNERLVRALSAGLAPDATEAMDLAEAHRGHITANFYDCGYEIHRGLAAMYLADPRFTATYEQLAPRSGPLAARRDHRQRRPRRGRLRQPG